MVRFRSHHFGSEAKNSKKLLFSLRFSPRFRGDFPSLSGSGNAHNASVSKLKIARNCYFLYAFHPDLEGIFISLRF